MITSRSFSTKVSQHEEPPVKKVINFSGRVTLDHLGALKLGDSTYGMEKDVFLEN